MTEERKKELCGEFGISYWDNWYSDNKLLFAIMDKLSEMSKPSPEFAACPYCERRLDGVIPSPAETQS